MFHQNSLPVSQQLYHNGDISFAQDFGGDFHPRVLVATKVRPFGGGGGDLFFAQMTVVFITEPWVLFSIVRRIS